MNEATRAQERGGPTREPRVMSVVILKRQTIQLPLITPLVHDNINEIPYEAQSKTVTLTKIYIDILY